MKVQIPDKFQPLFTRDKWRYKVYYGGRGGAKSWSFAIALLMMGMERPIRVLCARELQISIGDSVHRLLGDEISKYSLEGFYDVTRSEIRGANGTLFLFEGIKHNAKKVKSLEGIDICWVEEADAVSAESWNVLVPTIRKDGSEIWVSFNPDLPDHETYRRFVLQPSEDTYTCKVTYRDNPWFPEVLRREMEYDKQVDYNKYLWIWEGNPREQTDAQVFRGKYRVDRFETPTDVERFYYGADWGFSQDPTVLVRCFIRNQVLWIDYEAYAVGVDIDDTPQLFASVPGADTWPIVADSARPETISYMRKQGWTVWPSKKGKGSVEDGIAFIRSFRGVVIHERCKHTAVEFKLYSYKTDKITGDVLPILEDKHNHAVDALRYSLEKTMKTVGSVGKVSAADMGL